MSKKLRRKRKQAVTKKIPPKSGERIKMTSCVECPKDDTVIRMSDCVDCQYHDNNYCTLARNKQRIRTVSLSEPQKFNRLTFQISSESIQDDARNYYFMTNIMSPVKNITDCPQYTELKKKLLSGELCEQTKGDEPYTAQIKKPVIYLAETEIEEDICMVCGGKNYIEIEPFNASGDWDIIYYLYEMYSYGGLADMLIDDRRFKVKLKQICGYPEQMLVAGKGNQIIVGERDG